MAHGYPLFWQRLEFPFGADNDDIALRADSVQVVNGTGNMAFLGDMVTWYL
jgi:hypothetical protein